MKRILLILGLILFLVSIPSSATMVMEKFYDQEMNNKYKITEINEMFKGVPTSFEFVNSNIYVYHESKNREFYRDPWDYLIDISDVYININGQTEKILRDYPVKVEKKA